MKLFIDTANLEEIEAALKSGVVRGITTNPSLLAKEPKSNYLEHMRKIIEISKRYGGTYSVSIEVFEEEPAKMVAQAQEFVKSLGYEHLAIKIPVSYKGRDYLEVVKELSGQGITVNCTACMMPLQAMMAAASGAKYVSIFYNRLRDGEKEEKYTKERTEALSTKIIEQGDFDPDQVIRETRALLAAYPDAEIIAGSIRTPIDVKHAGLAGTHIVTTSLKIIRAALGHFKTDDAVELFLKDFAAWKTE
jgi:transaldolase